MSLRPLPIFVYGTLQRGEQREPLWPRPPTRVEPATTKGRLYDLGPYPALVPGESLVRGELWTIPSEHLDETLRVLDAIECYDQGGVDLYVRRIVECHKMENGQAVDAHTYHYSDERMLASLKVTPPNAAGHCRWSGHNRHD